MKNIDLFITYTIIFFLNLKNLHWAFEVLRFFKSLNVTVKTALKSVDFYSARNARIASAVLATAIPSVCPSVRLSVTRRYCVKTTARSTMQFAPLDNKMCLIL